MDLDRLLHGYPVRRLQRIPKELMEAGQVDGANDWQVFRHIIVPEMRPALTMVTTTMLVNVLKIFDIIYVMTNGNFGTEVIANRMFKEMFQFANTGRASAIAVVLFMMIIPIMYANVRQKLKGRIKVTRQKLKNKMPKIVINLVVLVSMLLWIVPTVGL